MKRILFSAALTALLIISCDEDETAPTQSDRPDSTYTKIIRDNEYQKRRIFDLGYPEEFDTGDSVLKVVAYKGRGMWPDIDATAKLARLVVDPDNPEMYASENEEYLQSLETGVELIPDDEYHFCNFSGERRHYVVFKSPQRDVSLGVCMNVYRSATGLVDTIGADWPDTALLKMIYSNKSDTNYHTYDLMWRNCYSVGRNLACEDLQLRIFRGDRGYEDSAVDLSYQLDSTDASQVDYITLLGLDQYDSQGEKRPDGILDYRVETLRPEWGLVIFPHRRPFASDTTYTDIDGIRTPALGVRVPLIYDADVTQAPLESQYYLRLDFTIPGWYLESGR